MYPENLRYSSEHEWINPEPPGRARIGITDYAQGQLGDIVFVELPEVGKKFEKGDTFGVVESVKTVSDLYMPVAGKVVAVNKSLEEEPELVNSSPHDKGWIVEIELSDASQVNGLYSAEEYEDHVSGLNEGADEYASKPAEDEEDEPA